MLPPLDPSSFKQVGNAAGQGAKLALLSISKRTEARSLASKANYIELAHASAFKHAFVHAIPLGIYWMSQYGKGEIV
jgi:uncharacterized 2Fe-2S/4Fe-4S cluster protein (DUF4445 family)